VSRWKAAIIHLSISVAVGLVSAALIFGIWYPQPFGQAAGAVELVRLLLGVDVVMGPLLTLVVFKSEKPSLRFDLFVIAALQACAFAYGTSIVVRARPAFVVAAIDRFVLVTANDLDATDLAEGRKPEFRSVPWTGPRLVGIEMPADANEKNKLMFSGLAGKDVEKFPKYYVEYSRSSASLLQFAKPLDALLQKAPQASSIVNAWLRKHHRDAGSIVWIPVSAPRDSLTMLLDGHTGETLDALPIDPW
jgi:hypothetical protein